MSNSRDKIEDKLNGSDLYFTSGEKQRLASILDNSVVDINIHSQNEISLVLDNGEEISFVGKDITVMDTTQK
jgi:hypothetical protein